MVILYCSDISTIFNTIRRINVTGNKMNVKIFMGISITILLLTLNFSIIPGLIDHHVEADTPVGPGNISSDTVWSVGNSPYFVEGSIYVEDGATLTIEPGVEVRFNGWHSLFIQGNLSAIGTQTERIKFTSNITEPYKDDWNSIVIEHTGHLKMENCDLEYGDELLLFSGSSDNIVKNCTFKSGYTGMRFQEVSVPPSTIKSSDNNTIQNCTFTRCNEGIYISYSDNNTILNCTLYDNEIYFEYSKNNILIGNKIWGGVGLSPLLDIEGDEKKYYNHSISETNMINGKPIYYIIEDDGSVIENLDASYIALVGCNKTLIRDNIVRNGMGISSFYTENSTVDNCTVVSNSGGVYLYKSSNNNITHNYISTVDNGIELDSSSDNTIDNNSISDTLSGIYLSDSINNSIQNNQLDHTLLGITPTGSFPPGPSRPYFNHTISTSNTINGKPVYYYFERKDEVISGLDAGSIYLAYCDNITIKDSRIDCDGHAIMVVGTVNSIVQNCTISSCFQGINIEYSTNNTILQNTISGSYNNIHIEGFSGNSIIGNNLSKSVYNIWLEGTSDNEIKDNNVSSSSYGIRMIESPQNILENNEFWDNIRSIWMYSWDEDDNESFNQSISPSNLVNGRPIYHVFEKSGLVLSEFEAGHISIACCDDITIEDSNVIYGDGITLYRTTNSEVNNCNVSGGFTGIAVLNSFTCAITNSNITNNYYGIWVDEDDFPWLSSYSYAGGFSSGGEPEPWAETVEVHNNSLLGNVHTNICIGYTSEGDNVRAQYNYFGTNDEEQIKKSTQGDVDYSNSLGFRESGVQYIETSEQWTGSIALDRGVIVNDSLVIDGDVIFNNPLGQNFIQVNGNLTMVNSTIQKSFEPFSLVTLNKTRCSIQNSSIIGQLGIGIHGDGGTHISQSSFLNGLTGVLARGHNINVDMSTFDSNVENSLIIGYFGGPNILTYNISIMNNQILNSYGGPVILGVNITISCNAIYCNGFIGLITYLINGTMTNNIISGAIYGAYVYSSASTITYNRLYRNHYFGLVCVGYNATIHHNNFINNPIQVAIDLDGEYSFDDGAEGNFWSDYMGFDDGSGGRIAGDGVGDTDLPHFGHDYYPLMNPVYRYCISLYKGWNLISIPLRLENSSIESVFKSIEGNYDEVRWYNSSDFQDPWKQYKVDKPFGNDLKEVNHTMGLWIYMKEDDILVITGELPTSTTITLRKGWNLVGYPSLTTQSLTEALSSISGKYNVIFHYDRTDVSDPWKRDLDGDLTEMEPDKGYWIHAKEDCNWVINN